ncbi:hypothetical protein KCU64_g15072, partial [Aureobasidium melanogenum]
MSSETSTSTISDETTSTATPEQGVCLVASEDLSSMVFQTADLQRITSSWASHHPLTGTEFEMGKSFKACESTANSLRHTLESLEVKAAKASQAYNEELTRSSHGQVTQDTKEDLSTSTLDFLVDAGIEKIIRNGFPSLSTYDGRYFQLGTKKYDRDEDRDKYEECKDAIRKAIENDTDQLKDFETKTKGYLKRHMIKHDMSELERRLEDQWKKYEDEAV